METAKKPAVLTLVRILEDAKVPYAIIGGIAVQVHDPDPRTTLDIEVAVLELRSIPQEALIAAGFRQTGSFEHSENWLSADRTPVQFTEDPLLAVPVESAGEVEVDGVKIRVIRAVDLLHEKLRAAGDPARRRSKRLQHLADAEALIETYRELALELRPDERALLARLQE